ncbi:MAG: hypothetical protein K0Q49_2186 [Haloplasmataceae bacterium]|nr:hypothetical protein [Haloplasmataceae bacterium]
MKSIKQLVILSFFSSIIIVGKVILALLPIPNIEVVTFLLIIYTLVFGFKRTLAISIVYSITEMLMWGFGVQLYIWILIVIITTLAKKVFKENFIIWSLYSGFFGLIFGFLCAIPKLLIDYSLFLSYFISGLPFDAIHMLGNYVIMLLIGEQVYFRLKKLTNFYGGM